MGVYEAKLFMKIKRKSQKSQKFTFLGDFGAYFKGLPRQVQRT